MANLFTIANFKLVSSIVSPFLAAYLASHWALKKHYKEKWWERKEIAYKDIIDSLYDLLQYCEIEKEDYGQGSEIQIDKFNELQERYNQAYWSIKKNITIAEYIVSEDAAVTLKKLQNREKLKWEENPPWEIFEAEYNAYKKALIEIIRISNIDLKKK